MCNGRQGAPPGLNSNIILPYLSPTPNTDVRTLTLDYPHRELLAELPHLHVKILPDSNLGQD